MSKSIVLFRNDLRLQDNQALNAAAKSSTVLPIYIYDQAPENKWQIGGASKWWLHHSLTSLSNAISDRGGKLILKSGDLFEQLINIIREEEIDKVYWNRAYDVYSINLFSRLKNYLKENAIEAHSFNSSLLFEPWEIKNKSGTYFKVFTPFWKNCLQKASVKAPELLGNISFCNAKTKSETLESWQLLPTKPDWSKGIREAWTVGEDAANERLDKFIKHGLYNYKEGRNFPNKPFTSRMSPHLRFGEISPRQIWHKIINSEIEKPLGPNITHYLSELGWREFSYHLLYHFPDLPEKPFRENFSDFPWQNNNTYLEAWQKGLTGYPIVDAAMRELYESGYMHNRSRMIVGSFLTKDLLIHWQEGEAWFWDCLVDADIASNSASWQWVSGSGADAAPYFRIFNPITQGERFDPDGEYVRRWVPELKNLPNQFIHKPWEMDIATLKTFGITLGVTYPERIIDHSKARDSALAAYQKIKK